MRDEIEEIDLSRKEIDEINIEISMPRMALFNGIEPATKDESEGEDMYLCTLTVYGTKADMMQILSKVHNKVIKIEI